MNKGKSPLAIPAVESSFNWSNAWNEFPPGKLSPMPSGDAQAIPPIQYDFASESSKAEALRESRQQMVKDVFLDDWRAYKQYAWKMDALLPLSNGGRDQFAGWSATLVDSLDTLWIMGLREEFDEAVNAVAGIDFGQSASARVNTFETNIRYLGGLLAAYDLSQREVLLTKAVELGDMLFTAFNTKDRMPVDFMNFADAKSGFGLRIEPAVVSASPGTLSLEMTRLSQVTGDPKYHDAISRVMELFYQGQNHTKLPGMWPMMVSMSRKDVTTGDKFTLAGCADSLYEYLPKMHALISGQDPRYETMTRGFMEAAKDTLLYRPMLPNEPDILMAGTGTVKDDGAFELDDETDHLSCFLGGVYGIAGRMWQNDEWLDIGQRLTLGCVYAYRAFPTGMGPERWNMVACKSGDKSTTSCPWDEARFDAAKKLRPEWNEHLPKGFTTAKDPRYILRPEAIESVMIMYRITGNEEYMDLGWDMFTAIANGTKTSTGTHAAVMDVTRALPKLEQEDYMESFWLAETLKYFYLLFSTPDIIHLDDFVFNTEAHPFLRTK
jgi:mannosyl-oligosaccharide alpha-1,2-mannosidase